MEDINLATNYKILLIVILVSIYLFTSCENKAKLNPSNPVVINVWHYYNDSQKVAFDKLVNKFNNTVGNKKGIIVKGSSQGDVSNLVRKVQDYANKRVGSEEMPNIFSAYPDIAYEVDSLGLVVGLNKYLSNKEIKEYVKGYIEEGYIDNSKELKILPVAKSTEIMAINKTDWDKFAKETNTSINDSESYNIESLILKAPIFKGANKVAIQQGGGMVVTKSDDKREYASVEFLKWFTSENTNVEFSIESHYLPVKKSSNKINEVNSILNNEKENSGGNNKLLLVALETVNNYKLYSTKSFKGSIHARNILEKELIKKAKEDTRRINLLMENGLSRNDAILKVNFRDNFNKWYEDFVNKLNDSIK